MEKKRFRWVYVTLLGLVLFLIAWLILAVYSAQIALSTTTYFFLLVIAALCATAFLTGALRSSATYAGTAYHGKLKLSGSVVVFLLIMIAGYKFRPLPKNEPFDLTIYVYGEGGRSDPIKSGIIRIQDGNETKSGAIDSNGRVVINNVNPSYLGKKVLITSSVNDFHIASGDTQITVPSQNLPVVFLPLVQNNDSLRVTGTVVDKNRKLLKSAELHFTEFSKKTTTDNDGNFEIYLPAKKGYQTGLLITVADKIVFNSDVMINDFLNIQVNE